MLAQTFRGPHNLYRRYQAIIEQAATAFGLALVVTMTLTSFQIYPENWVLVIGTAITLLGIRWPTVAFMISVGVITYPLFLINFYLAVLFLAISALGHRVFVHYLGATVLTLATPLLAEYHLHWLVPVLVGLWWGGTTGAWVGGLACLWGKIVAGIAGVNIDWLEIAGQTPNVQVIITRFENANSLETLLLLVEPFAADPDVVLYNLLQIIGWATAAGFVGSLAWRKWVKYRTPWSILLVTTGGGLILLLTHLGLPYWLENAVTPEALQVVHNPIGPMFSLIVVIIVGTVVHSLRESLDLPVAPPKNIWATSRQKAKSTGQRNPLKSSLNLFKRTDPSKEKRDGTSKSTDSESPRQPVRVPDYSELPEWEPPKDESGLIMLEID